MLCTKSANNNKNNLQKLFTTIDVLQKFVNTHNSHYSYNNHRIIPIKVAPHIKIHCMIHCNQQNRCGIAKIIICRIGMSFFSKIPRCLCDFLANIVYESPRQNHNKIKSSRYCNCSASYGVSQTALTFQFQIKTVIFFENSTSYFPIINLRPDYIIS